MARLTILPDVKPDIDQCEKDNTRPEPLASTPPTPKTPATPEDLETPGTPKTPSLNPQHKDDIDHRVCVSGDSPPILQASSTQPPTPENPISDTEASNTTETTTYISRTDEDLIAALHLISDSIAQQHQVAARALLTHPAYWSCLLLTLPYFYVEWYHDSSDWPLIIVVWVGTFMATLAVIKWVVRGYLDAAERVGRWSWLYGDQWIKNRFRRTMNPSSQTPRPKRTLSRTRDDHDPDFKTDFVFVTKLQGQIIAALVVRLENTWCLNPRPLKTRHPLKAPANDIKGDHLRRKAIIRAWTVDQRYRGQGIGIALLRFVVRWCLDNEIEGPEFSDEHAHSLRLLPEPLNKGMDDLDRRAREKLYWEVQHCVEVRGWERFEEREMVRGAELSEKGGAGFEGEGGMEASEWLSPGPGPRSILSPRKRVQMSRAITREILKRE